MRRIAPPRVKTLAAATALSLAFGAEAVTLTVVNGNDSGAGSLRAALQTIQADTACTGAPYIVNFSTGGLTVVPLQSALPPVTCFATIDGYDQAVALPTGATANTSAGATSGSNAVPKIVLDANAVTGGTILVLTVPNSGVRGLVFKNHPGTAILASGSATKVGGNFIGVDETGLACAAKPSSLGIQAGGIGALIGSAIPADVNVIGCNPLGGVSVFATGVQVKGNLIGIGKDGATPLGNGFGVTTSANNISIGGTAASEANVIAYSSASGIQFGNFNGIVVSGNQIFQNALLGIDLGNDGIANPNNTNFFPVLAPNSGENYPVIGSVTYQPLGAATSLNGSMHGFSNSTTGMEFFDNSGLLGLDQGERFAGSGSVSVVSPPAAFSVTLPGAVRNPSATANNTVTPNGTSEFSPSIRVPQFSLSVPDLAPFAAITVGTSASQTVTITNGPSPTTFSGVSILPAAGSPFTATSTCPPTIGAGANCTATFTFSPLSAAVFNALGSLNFQTSTGPAANVSFQLTLSGTAGPAIAPGVTKAFAPTSVAAGAPSILTITLNNTNSGPLTAGAFIDNYPAGLVNTATPAAATTCGGSPLLTAAPNGTSLSASGIVIPLNSSCTISANVTSASPGSYLNSFGPVTGVVGGTPVSSAIASQTLTVTPAAAPAVLLAPTVLNFGNVTVANTAGPLVATLTNSGTAPLVLSPFSTLGDFAQTSTCPLGGPGIAPATSCQISVTFTPTTTGTRSGNVTIPSNATPPSNLLNLVGVGVAAPVPVVGLSSTALTFAAQSLGSTSAAQVVTLTNTGTAPLSISAITSSGDFALSTGCSATLAASPGPGNSCTISVTFTPVLAGTRTGSITITDNASGSPHVVSLAGVGTVPLVPTISVSPVVTFPTTQVGTVSAPLSVTIGNTGAASLIVSQAQIVGAEFAIVTDACTGTPVPADSSCVITVAFAPAATGVRAASLRIISNAPATSTLVTLNGTGSPGAAGTLAAAPATVTFGEQVTGTSSAPQTVTVTNSGTSAVTVSTVGASGDFSQTNTCTVIPAGASCTVSVVFTPTIPGARVAVLTIVSNASNATLTVNLSGTGALIAGPVIQLSATSLGYGNRMMGTGSASQPVTLRNIGGANLLINQIYVTGDFVQTNSCPATVAPGASCRLDVSFLPSVPGKRSGTLFVSSNATPEPKQVNLQGAGCRVFTVPGSRITSLLCN